MEDRLQNEEEKEETRPQEGKEGRPGEQLQQRLVLVVDDDPDLREFVRQALEGAHYRVKVANDGREALSVLADESPDVMLLDIRMPGLSGEQVLELLRSIRGMPPIVIMTAGERARDLALEKHNPLYLAKPFDAALLLATIETALGIEEESGPEYDA